VVGYARDRPAEQGLIDMASLVEQVLNLRQYQLGRLGAATMVDRGPNGDYRVRGDERPLTQALLNLVLNSEEALASVTSRQLRVTLAGTSDVLRLTVSDTGSGVDPALQDSHLRSVLHDEHVRARAGIGIARQPGDHRGARWTPDAVGRHARRNIRD
jgi:C4-dicarboxylate-specific signal transduction histidine kinase